MAPRKHLTFGEAPKALAQEAKRKAYEHGIRAGLRQARNLLRSHLAAYGTSSHDVCVLAGGLERDITAKLRRRRVCRGP